MSYSQAGAYREREILTASPEKLVVLIFDHVLANLRRVRIATEAHNAEQRVAALRKAREGVMELLVSTDIERGGEVATNLRSLYAFVLRELMTVGRTPDLARIDKIADILGNLRDAFAEIAATSLARDPAA